MKQSLLSIAFIFAMCPAVFAQCTGNACVWPGDTDNDGTANVWDLLPIGLGYGDTGPKRASASINWTGQSMHTWSDTLATGLDLKFIDSDGNGIINAADTTAISLNYGLKHNKKSETGNSTQSDPGLNIIIKEDTVLTETAVSVLLELGTVDITADSIYGLAFTLHYNKELIDSASIDISLKSSWLGSTKNDMLSMNRNFYDEGRIDIAMVRTDKKSKSGFGQIGELNIITADNLAGKSEKTSRLDISFSNVVVITSTGKEIAITANMDSLFVTDSSALGIKQSFSEEDILLYPNPAGNNGFFIKPGNTSRASMLTIMDIHGRKVMEKIIGKEELFISSNNMVSGIYQVIFTGRHYWLTKTITISK